MTQVTAQDNSQDDKQIVTPAKSQVSSLNKETEPVSVDSKYEEEGKLISEIKEVSAEADRKQRESVSAELSKIGENSRDTEATIRIPADVEEAGVHDIASSASKVIKKGSTINLDITEDQYERGLKVKVGGISSHKSILNVSSVVALAIWIGRQLKRAHGKTMKVVFKKGVDDAN